MLLAAGSLTLCGCAGSGTKTVSVPDTAVASPAAAVSSQSTSSAAAASPHQTSSAPSAYRYTRTGYTIAIPSKWTPTQRDVPEGNFASSVWTAPSGATITVDVVAGETTPPADKAAQVQAALSGSSGYTQIASGPSAVDNGTAFRWLFDISGDERVDYFLNQCSTGIAVLGSSPLARFAGYRSLFAGAADSLQFTCPATTTSGPPTQTATDTQLQPGTGTGSATPAGCGQSDNNSPPCDPSNPPADFCDTHQCIENFPNGNGYVVQCNDGMWSQSGGISGACSDHGGESDNPPGP